MSASLLERAVRKHGAERVYASLPAAARERLRYEWGAWARPEQLAPDGEWRTWMVLAGRGFGKTRLGAEWVRAEVEAKPGIRIALIAPTAADVRDVMVEGPSGLMSISPPWFRPEYEPSKRRLTWPNGSVATTFSADEPERLRGPQYDIAWCDELAAWRYAEDAWDNLQFGLRLGTRSRAVVTTTPRSVKLVRELIKAPSTVITRGSTFDNAANLDPGALAHMKAKYEGTRIGRQELYAEVLEDVPGALWTRAQIDATRIGLGKAPPLVRVVIGLDPSGGAGERGIVANGIGWCTCKGVRALHGFTLSDVSGVYTADSWGRAAVNEYRARRADRIVVEKNFGGDMAASLLRTVDPGIAVTEVTASRGKQVRAEPVAALYEQGRWHHVGTFPELEEQMCTYTPLDYDGSPDRMDAHVWGVTALMLDVEQSQPERIESSGHRRGGREDGIL